MNGNGKGKIGNTIEDKLEAAKLYHRGGHFQQAENLYREILKQQPDNPEATHYMGLLAMQMGKFDIAEHFFETALQLKEDNPEVYANLGVLNYLKRDYKKAKALLQKALDMDWNFIEAHANLGKILAEEKLWKEARKHLVKAVNMGDIEFDTMITLAEVNFKLKLFHRSEELCKQLIELGHSDKRIFELLSESLMVQEKYKDAIPYIEVLINMDNDNEYYKKLLKKAYEKIGIL